MRAAEFLGDRMERLMKGLLGFVLAMAAVLATGSSRASTEIEDAAEVAAHQASVDVAVAPLRSMRDVRSHLRTTPTSPLFALGPAQRKQFIASLVFTSQGLGSYSNLPLSQGLSVSQAYKVLALFGAQSAIAEIPGLPLPQDEVEARMVQLSLLSPMAAAPRWAEGTCVVHGRDVRCRHRDFGMCYRACDPR
jgi:hypothetical protein